jgi:type II restriction enzyme
MPSLFTEEKPDNGFEYIKMLGNIKNTRVYRWFRRDYIKPIKNIDLYKVLVPKANGTGALGEELSTPLIAPPLVGFTETYISIGETKNLQEAEATLKYIKTRFARTLLGILKVTHNNPKPTWEYVPMQDFTEHSDIDWSKSVAEIDAQLYKKYNLTPGEITFIETMIKPME